MTAVRRAVVLALAPAAEDPPDDAGPGTEARGTLRAPCAAAQPSDQETGFSL
jgi:hypothetical protein